MGNEENNIWFQCVNKEDKDRKMVFDHIKNNEKEGIHIKI